MMNPFRKAAVATAVAALTTGAVALAGPISSATAAPAPGPITISDGQSQVTLGLDPGDLGLDPSQFASVAQQVATQLQGSLDPSQLQQLATQFAALLQQKADPATLTALVDQGAAALEKAGLPADQVAQPLEALLTSLADGGASVPSLPGLPSPQDLSASSVVSVLDTITGGLKQAGLPVDGALVSHVISTSDATGVSSETLIGVLDSVVTPLENAGVPAQQLVPAVRTVLDKLTAGGTTNPSDIASEVIDGLQQVTDQGGQRGAEWNTWADAAGVQLDQVIDAIAVQLGQAGETPFATVSKG